MADSRAPRSPLAMVLLALLAEESMHPYRMQQMIKERGQDQLVNVAQRNSVYQALDKLVRDGLARPAGTAKDGGRPERTAYEVTDAGKTELRRWVAERLRTPAREFPEFPAALAFMAILGPVESRALLAERLTEQQKRLAAIKEQAPPDLHRLFLIEDEYRAAVLTAEIDWLRSVVADLDSGALSWPEFLKAFQ